MQESWAICRIFKKTNSTAQRALSHSWVSSLPETRTSGHILTKDQESTQFCSDISFTKKTTLASQYCAKNYNDAPPLTPNSSRTLCPFDAASYKSIINPLLYKAFDHFPISNNGDLSTSFLFSSPFETSDGNTSAKSAMDVSSMLLNMSSSVLGDFNKTSEDHTNTTTSFGALQEHYSGYPLPFLREMQTTFGEPQYDNINALVKAPNVNMPRVEDQELGLELETVRSIGFPFSGMPFGDAWKSNLLWDTSSFPCDVSSSFSTTKCNT